jgi:cytochrome b561
MFLANRKGAFWAGVTLAAAVALVALYLMADRPPGGGMGGTPLGVAYGFVALALFGILLAFGVRKRAYRSTVGTLSGWLQAHLYLGVLVLLVVLLHAGFEMKDRVAAAAFVCMALVVLSGFVGVVAYSLFPRLLTDVESNLSAEEISAELNRLAGSMARLAAGKSGAFGKIYRRVEKEARPGWLAGWGILGRRIGRRVGKAGEAEAWEPLLKLVPAEEREPLRNLLVLSRQHKELHLRLMRQQRYRNLMDVWLFLHLPLSIALIVLVAAHVIAAFFYAEPL